MAMVRNRKTLTPTAQGTAIFSLHLLANKNFLASESSNNLEPLGLSTTGMVPEIASSL